jgi:TorA maturation chaperone TorD
VTMGARAGIGGGTGSSPRAGELARDRRDDRRQWRRDVYSLLAIAFRRPPLPLGYGELAALLSELLRAAPWGEALASSLASLCIEESFTLHTALVLVGGTARTPVRLYESCWRGAGTLWGEAAAECSAYYRRVGFELDEGVHECPDALGVELELMAHLCDRGDGAEAASFLTKHLLRWAPQAAASLAAAALPPFFRLAGDVLGRFLAAEEDEIITALPAPDIDGAYGRA